MSHKILPDDLLAEMDRLGARPYPEIGVPMYLLPEDLTGQGAPAGASTIEGEALAEAFTAAAARVEAAKGPLDARDIARIVEVIADRTFLDRPFSDLSDEG